MQNQQFTDEQMRAEFDTMSVDEQAALAVGTAIMAAFDKKLPPEQVADIVTAGLDFHRTVVHGGMLKALTTPRDEQPYSLLTKKGDEKHMAQLQRAVAYSVCIVDEVKLKKVDRFYNLVEGLLGVELPERKGEAA